jgi:periplasmic protein TonB
MEQPKHDLRSHAPTGAENVGSRGVSLAVVAAIHVGLGFALIAGLKSGMLDKLPEELKAEVVQPKDAAKPPPPPPPDLAKPPPPFVPPPEINITTDAPSTNAITTQSVVPTPPPPPAPPQPAPTQLTAITRTHTLPPYPDLSRKLNEQGSVVLEVTIDTSGNCTDATVQTSSGSQRLDDAAVAWVKAKWRWNPPTQNGQPSSARTLVKVTFNLKNG